MKKIYILICLLSVSLFISCFDPKNEKTQIEVIDNDRHYYPIQTGQPLDVVFKIKNIGSHPLIMTDIITSCGCLLINKSTTMNIPGGEEGLISLTYNSTKNVGYVKHWIEVYGNFKTAAKVELIFDVNVVPDAHYSKDYEELHQMEKEKNGNIKDLVDGKANNKGYYKSFSE